jgi:hypothetical protein
VDQAKTELPLLLWQVDATDRRFRPIAVLNAGYPAGGPAIQNR